MVAVKLPPAETTLAKSEVLSAQVNQAATSAMMIAKKKKLRMTSNVLDTAQITH
ncbi:hypothetical protein Acy02nite_68370 [Actinoplanes cyaneus]|uniref:Uncharacterized protein n=1 Tax=Actinoplanes cyaneus TaxID=52696 RepID=A0A919IPS5_9ACTN|nr:hypothetical protein Acy02nite_68370 [Actinoplanes cyaneus]